MAIPPRRRLVCLVCAVACAALGAASPAAGQEASPDAAVVEVLVEQEGRPVSEPTILRLVGNRVGAPLEVRDVRETIAHLMSLNRFLDVRAYSEPAAGGIRLRYDLVPLHPIDRIEFHGTLGLSEGDLRRVIEDRYGTSPPAARAGEIADALRAVYRRRGFARATVEPRVIETHEPDRATLRFDVVSGARVPILDVRMTQVDADEETTIATRPDIRAGQPYDDEVIARRLRAWENGLRGRGFYEARASHGVQLADDGAYVTVNLSQGRLVVVTFSGEPLPGGVRDRLVPIRAEGSADEDLLEDSSRAVETYFHERGYRDAEAFYTTQEKSGELVVNFQIDRGPRYLVRSVSVTGAAEVPQKEVLSLVRLARGDPFVRATAAVGAGSIAALYRTRGYTRVDVRWDERVTVPERVDDPDRQTDVVIIVEPGPRTLVRSVSFVGNGAVDEAALRLLALVVPGQPYAESEIVAARDRIDLEYRNRGFEAANIAVEPTLAEDDTQADVLFRISEGEQVLVDHVIITGNRRISTETIRRELLLREGEPLGYTALVESRARLSAMRLFRRSQITAVGHGGDARRDVLVEIEEAPPTVLSVGPGIEGGYITKVGTDGLAVERFQVAPRGFFQIGRRYIGGKNRQADLFTRISLRTTEALDESGRPIPIEEGTETRFYEYRVIGQFREPRLFDTSANLLLTGISEQARRSSFNFSRREVRAEVPVRLSPVYNFIGQYSFQRTKLFDERFPPEEQPIIDRLFPEVRLSKVSGSIIRDSRDDALDASRGALFMVEGELAARALGSEVGFVQTYVQGFFYRRLPSARRIVLALGARVGAAHGFERELDGEIVQDLPASERFFAGGDTSVRGFALDRLGNEQTITPSGFPTGGNGVIILNSELRVGVFGALSAVGFLDAGNVFLRASDFDFTDLRPAAGFGLMFRSPVGPVRVDLGFNLDPRELVSGTTERRTVLHILLGQAF